MPPGDRGPGRARACSDSAQVQGEPFVTEGPTRAPLALVARLRRLDTSAVSDAIDVLGVGGVVTGISPIWPSAPVAGRVVPPPPPPPGAAVRAGRPLPGPRPSGLRARVR